VEERSAQLKADILKNFPKSDVTKYDTTEVMDALTLAATHGKQITGFEKVIDVADQSDLNIQHAVLEKVSANNFDAQFNELATLFKKVEDSCQ
jgi:hypothetical protein